MTVQPNEEIGEADKLRLINDFSITVATVNGSGSQTSNITILRSLFKMGIPVSGKNLFPSNIQGLPTWYTIRISKDGFLARREEQEIVIAMNPATFTKDLANVVPGGAFYYADDIKLPINRSDVALYPMPIKQLVRLSDAPSNLRDYISNMVYVGILSQMIGIDIETIKDALNFHFRGKQKPIDMNFHMIQVSYDWAAANLKKNDPYYVQPMDLTREYIMADGNTAAALGSIYGGVQFAAWYPITPATSLAEALNAWLPQLRKDPEEPGKHNFAVVQAEDELAAIGMATGAGWAGLRSMTSTSGPGISLMTEYAGLAYFTEVPVVIWNVQRVGPSTGLPTRTAQGDLSFTYFMGHGDTNFVILLPGSVNECFEFGWRAFDIAEHIQSPVFVLSDLDFGMNQWMTKPFQYPNQPMDRGKILWEEDLEKIQGNWGRYRDVDGDGIPYRTVPGNCHPNSAYFTRGTGHDEDARYTEDPGNWHHLLERLKVKYLAARTIVPRPVLETMEGAQIGIIAFGSTDSAIQEARAHLAKSGIPTDFMRIRAIPFTEEVGEFMVSHRVNYVFEMNRDGQLNQLLTLEHPERCHNVVSIAYTDGLPPSARQVREAILTEEAKLA
jgi:2-oxoglutarate/2-oxoacid ferredoxin oxidoreductase subunit alpha